MAAPVEKSLLEPAAPPDASGASDARRDRGLHRFARPAVVAAIGYLCITLVLLAVGELLTHALNGSVGRWDEHVNEYFARHRNTAWNDITKVATSGFNTVPVVVAAAVSVGFLAWRRHFREAIFLTLALVIEITAFLSVTFVVARPRPDVVRLNSTPATSSFPSGHTAAATVLFVGITVIVACCTTRLVARVGAALLAAIVVSAVGFARVYRGLHHPTDVFVGVLFGLACLAVAALAIRAFGEHRRATSERAPEGSRRRLEHALVE
jgi:membrane-associated phospholipid phosphatase